MTDLPRIGAPATSALKEKGIEKLEDLRKFSEEEIKDLHGMGPKALGILKEVMKKLGIFFKESS